MGAFSRDKGSSAPANPLSGLTQAEVDARIQALVERFAWTGNPARLEAAKLPDNLLHGYSTDDLIEGARQYFTAERSRGVMETTLVAGPHMTVTPNDAQNRIVLDAIVGAAQQPYVLTVGRLYAVLTQVLTGDGQIPNNANQVIEIPGEAGAFHAPRISNLAISGLDPDNPPLANAALGGQRTVTFTVSNSANVNGNLTLQRKTDDNAWVDISNAIAPAAGSVNVNFPALAAAAGSTYRYRLTGTDTNPDGAGTFSSDTIVIGPIAQEHERAYWLTQNNNSVADFESGDADGSADVTASGSTFSIDLSVPDTHWFIILVPSDRELASAIGATRDDELASFTKQQNALVIAGQQYTAYTIHNQSGLGRPQQFRYDCTTE